MMDKIAAMITFIFISQSPIGLSLGVVAEAVVYIVVFYSTLS
jgi:hypothetical protein